ncbi:MAG TPA: hypothetical protein VFM17_01755 [Candidatus Eisenbacteria bacterium]|nr:hypothetical protein [Candidatus Eisenbacteria bacterium]
MATRRRVTLALLLVASLLSVEARAQSASGAQSTFLDPSIVASGMGRAGVAVFWGDEPNDWANPALLGSQRGIRYQYGRTRLVPDLADDVTFTSKRLLVGAGGLGFSFAGKPLGSIGDLFLDYGESVATDPDGNVIGVYDSFEEIHQLSVGLQILEVVENGLRLLGKPAPDLNRYVDLSIGHSWKSVEVDLAPASLTLDGRAARGEAKERDRGVLLRVTPLDQTSEEGSPRLEGVRFRLDGSVGYSRRNKDHVRIALGDPADADPILEERILGFAGRITMRLPHDPGDWIWDFLSPSVSVGGAWESAKYYDGDARVGGDPSKRRGQEIVVGGIVAGRIGHETWDDALIDGDTYRVSLMLQYRRMAGIRYDFASVPQSVLLDDVDREGFTLFLDPCRLWKELR